MVEWLLVLFVGLIGTGAAAHALGINVESFFPDDADRVSPEGRARYITAGDEFDVIDVASVDDTDDEPVDALVIRTLRGKS